MEGVARSLPVHASVVPLPLIMPSVLLQKGTELPAVSLFCGARLSFSCNPCAAAKLNRGTQPKADLVVQAMLEFPEGGRWAKGMGRVFVVCAALMCDLHTVCGPFIWLINYLHNGCEFTATWCV